MFGKKSIKEAEAARRFIDEFLPSSLQAWPQICEKLEPTDSSFRDLGKDRAAAFEFALALLSIQMRALNNLLPADQAKRIEQHIFAVIRNPPREIIVSPLLEDGTPKMTIDEIGFFGDEERNPNADTTDYPEQSIALYRQVFDSALEDGDILTSGPAVLLGMRLGLITQQRQYRPEIIQPLFQYLSMLGGSWWKECLKQYRITL